MYLVLPDSPGWFLQDFTSPVVLKVLHYDDVKYFAYRTFTFFGFAFQQILL